MKIAISPRQPAVRNFCTWAKWSAGKIIDDYRWGYYGFITFHEK
jgi:hypothetical protein